MTPEQIDFLRPRVPVGYLEFLQRNGWASYNSRRFQFVDPLPFQPIVEAMFKGDPDFNSNQIVVTGVEAFGIFSIWTGQHGVATLDIGTMSLTCHRLAKPDLGGPALPPLKRKPINAPHNEARGLIPFEPERIDFWDPMNVAQFGKAVSEFGSLEAGEVFGFAPPLVQLAGAVPRHPLERMARMSAVDVLTEAAQATVPTLGRRVRGRWEVVRAIGRAGQE